MEIPYHNKNKYATKLNILIIMKLRCLKTNYALINIGVLVLLVFYKVGDSVIRFGNMVFQPAFEKNRHIKT